jgi:drug/metabolite transporter (DMT)-like permease
LAISTGQLAAASVLMVPVVTFESIIRPPHLTAVDSSSLLLLGAMGTGVAYLLYYRLVADTGATSASLVTYLIPVFGAALGWLVLDETLGVRALVGAVLVIAGIAIAEGLGSKGEDERQFAEPPAGVSNAGSAAPGPGPSG